MAIAKNKPPPQDATFHTWEEPLEHGVKRGCLYNASFVFIVDWRILLSQYRLSYVRDNISRWTHYDPNNSRRNKIDILEFSDMCISVVSWRNLQPSVGDVVIQFIEGSSDVLVTTISE
jgi:hypothetical protein